jgi:hypothetical protein
MGAIDLKSNIKMKVSIQKAAKTATENGGSFEVADYHSACFVVDAGTWTDGTHTIEFQESDDDSTWTAIADGDLDGSEPVIDGATDDDQQYYVGYMGNKRYVRVKNTVASATTGAVVGAYVLAGHPHHIPA